MVFQRRKHVRRVRTVRSTARRAREVTADGNVICRRYSPTREERNLLSPRCQTGCKTTNSSHSPPRLSPPSEQPSQPQPRRLGTRATTNVWLSADAGARTKTIHASNPHQDESNEPPAMPPPLSPLSSDSHSKGNVSQIPQRR